MHTSFLSLATQTQLARYQEATGCNFQCKADNGEWVSVDVATNPARICTYHHEIRLKLSDLNLPSHLPPRNPENVHADVITAGGYRAWTVMERLREKSRSERNPLFSVTERWLDGKWDSTGWNGDFEDTTYRVPVSVPFPDWHLAGEPEEAVKPDTPTPTFSTPQPITDPMPPLTEGCQRYYVAWANETWCGADTLKAVNDTHFFDLQDLPAPVDANRSAFESAMAETGFQDFRRKGDNYEAVYAAAAWKGWNLRNS